MPSSCKSSGCFPRKQPLDLHDDGGYKNSPNFSITDMTFLVRQKYLFNPLNQIQQVNNFQNNLKYGEINERGKSFPQLSPSIPCLFLTNHSWNQAIRPPCCNARSKCQYCGDDIAPIKRDSVSIVLQNVMQDIVRHYVCCRLKQIKKKRMRNHWWPNEDIRRKHA